MHGFLLVAHRSLPLNKLQSLIPLPARYKSYGYTTIGVAITFLLVALALVSFRAPNIQVALDMYRGLLNVGTAEEWAMQLGSFVTLEVLILFHVFEWWVIERNAVVMLVWRRVPALARGTAYAVPVLLIIELNIKTQTFIYFRF